jgi:hypothetical protein
VIVGGRSFAERLRAVASGPGVEVTPPDDAAAWEIALPEPADLAARFAFGGEIELADGTRLIGRADVARATAWLVEERALDWPDDLVVIGERDDLVVVRDLDADGARAGGGVLEAPTDGLRSFTRVALHVVEYLEARLGAPFDLEACAPERAARLAVDRRDEAALDHALARPWYPGADAERSRGFALVGELAAARGDEAAAMRAFESAAAARAAAAPRGSGAAAASAAWRSFAAATSTSAPTLSAACAARATAAS